jgi:hypothetical protein
MGGGAKFTYFGIYFLHDQMGQKITSFNEKKTSSIIQTKGKEQISGAEMY